MAVPTTVRLPLQVGTACVGSIARAALGLVPVGGGLIEIFTSSFPIWFLILFGGLALVLVPYVVFHLKLAWRKRPSDLLLLPTGVQVDGGPHHRRRIDWSQLPEAGVEFERVKEPWPSFWRRLLFLRMRQLDALVEVGRLRLVLASGERLVLAEAATTSEIQSLDRLARTLRAGAQRHLPGAATAEAPSPPEVLRCGACAAPLVPADVERVTCHHCGAQREVPATLREQLRSQAALEAGRPQVGRAVRRLLRQPGAHRVNQFLLPAAVAMLAVWPVAIIARTVLRIADPLATSQEGALMMLPLSLVGGLYFLVRAGLVERTALQLLTYGFAAQPAEGSAPGLGCRMCRATLPISRDAPVVTCPYCRAENLVAVNLMPEAGQVAAEVAGLDALLRQRRYGRLRWAGMTALALLLLADAARSVEMATDQTIPPRVRSAHSPSGLQQLTWEDDSPSWPFASADGWALYYSRQEPQGPRLVTTTLLQTSRPKAHPVGTGAPPLQPVLVPGTTRVLGLQPAPGGQVLLAEWVLGQDEPRRVLHQGRALERPTVDAAGLKVAFSELDDDGTWQVKVISMDGVSPALLLGPGRVPSMRPDGKQVALIDQVDGRRRLFVVRLSKPEVRTRVRTLKGEESEEDFPFWSPDNQWLAWLSNADWEHAPGGAPETAWNIFALHTTHGAVRVTEGNVRIQEPAWAEGNKLFFRAPTDGCAGPRRERGRTCDALFKMNLGPPLSAVFWADRPPPAPALPPPHPVAAP